MNRNQSFSLKILGRQISAFIVGDRPRVKRPTDTDSLTPWTHSHFTYEIFFITGGRLTVFYPSGSTVYERGAVIIPPRLCHYTVPDSDDCFCLLFTIDSSDAGGIPEAISGCADNNGILSLALPEQVFPIAKMLSEYRGDTVLYRERASHIISLLFLEVFSLLLPEHTKKGVPDNQKRHIGKIETIINENIGSKMQLSFIAERAFLSQKQISRIIRREYGCTLSELLTKKRLTLALSLLKDTGLSIGEIAEKCGFSSESYFHVSFKKQMGITPLSYRKRSK